MCINQSDVHIFRYFNYYVLIVDGEIIYIANKVLNEFDVKYTYPETTNYSQFTKILKKLMNIDGVKFERMMSKLND